VELFENNTRWWKVTHQGHDLKETSREDVLALCIHGPKRLSEIVFIMTFLVFTRSYHPIGSLRHAYPHEIIKEKGYSMIGDDFFS
jgi:hypothetical protein